MKQFINLRLKINDLSKKHLVYKALQAVMLKRDKKYIQPHSLNFQVALLIKLTKVMKPQPLT